MYHYHVPVKERFTRVPAGAPDLLCACKVFEFDGFKIFVEYTKEEMVTREALQQRFILIRESYRIVRAENDEELVSNFFRDIPGAIGENPAVWMNNSRGNPIIRYPFCKFIGQTERGRFICGPEVSGENQGTRGLCVLEEGVDPPASGHCPINEMRIDLRKRRKVNVGGKDYFFVVADYK